MSIPRFSALISTKKCPQNQSNDEKPFKQKYLAKSPMKLWATAQKGALHFWSWKFVRSAESLARRKLSECNQHSRSEIKFVMSFNVKSVAE